MHQFSRRLFILTGKSASSDVYEVEWYCHYKDLKGPPVIKFRPDEIEIILKVNFVSILRIKIEFFSSGTKSTWISQERSTA